MLELYFYPQMGNVCNADNEICTGLCKGANEEHAKHLPIMNGIKEDIKSIGVLDSGTSVYQEALYNLSGRLKSLQVYFSSVGYMLKRI